MINKSSKLPLNNNRKTIRKTDSFMEAIRELGNDFGSTVGNDLVKGGGKDIFESLFPFTKDTKTENITDQNPPNNKENIFYRTKFQQSEVIRKQEVLLFSQEQRKTQKQVNILQNEIKQLAKATGDLAREAQTATINDIPVAGKYHKNFFEMLISLIRKLRSQIQESSFWLASWNKKAQRKNFYWGQAKKSGSSFLLHHDRSVATQTG